MNLQLNRPLTCSLLAAIVGCAGCGERAGAPSENEVIEIPTVLVEPARPRDVPAYSKDVAPLVEKYCLKCHDAAGASGGVVLENLGNHVGDKRTALLIRVAENLRCETMPPEGEPRPEAADLDIIHDWIDAATNDAGLAAGGALLRRLNHAQYNHTIRDLTGLDLRPADEFPSDDVGYGFDNIGEVLSTPPVLVEMYLAAAEKIIDAVFRAPELRARIMNPPGDFIPLVFRQYKAPVRSPRENKVLRPTPISLDPALARQQRIYDILRAFADHAFRRPATHDEPTRLLELVISAENNGENPETAIRLGLQAVLASPHFLFIGLDPSDGPGRRGGALPVQDFALAARLSYFLWSSTPDDELLRLASQGASAARMCWNRR